MVLCVACIVHELSPCMHADVEIEMNEVEDIHQDVSLEVVDDQPAEASPSAPPPQAPNPTPTLQLPEVEPQAPKPIPTLQLPEVEPQAPKPIPTLQLPDVETRDIRPPKLSTLRSYSVPAYMESERHRLRTKSSSKQVPDDDDICFIEEIDICLDIPSKLRQIDYPKVADAHEEDVAKVIRKKFSKLGIDEDHADIFNFLSSGELQTSYISWQARIEEAVVDESDEFWENVRSYHACV